MNIKGIEQGIHIKTPADNKVHRDDGFKQIFDKTISNINAQNPPSHMDSKLLAIDRGDKVLGLLDNYIGKLGDPSASLKELHPIVTGIEKALADMRESIVNAGSGDRDLVRFLDDIAVTANVAVLKYQRGDYID